MFEIFKHFEEGRILFWYLTWYKDYFELCKKHEPGSGWKENLGKATKFLQNRQLLVGENDTG